MMICIPEKKYNELALKASVAETDDCIKIFDAKKCIYINNAGLKEHFNKVSQGVLLKSWTDTFDRAQKKNVLKSIRNAFKGEKSQLIVEHLVSGSRRKFCLIRFVPKGKNILVISRDVTDLKTKEAELLSLSLFPEENPDPIMRISSRGKVLFQNRPAAT